MFGCLGGDPGKPVYAILPYTSSITGGQNGTVTTLASDSSGAAYRLMLPSIMAGQEYTSSTQIYYRYDGVNNPWARSYTLPIVWYNNHLTKMFTCDMARNVYLGDFVEQLYQDVDGVWECPEDGTYKIIMVGGGGGGGYDLVEYGGNGQTSSVAPQRNGGQGTMAAIGYGAGGCAQSNGADGVIVIVR